MVWIFSLALTAGARGWWVAAAAFPAVLVVFPFVSPQKRRCAAAVFLLAAACFSHGLLAFRSSVDEIAETRARARAGGSARSTYVGWVSGFPEHRPGGVRFPFRTMRDGRGVTLLATAVAFGVAYGDSLELSGTLTAGRRDREGSLVSRRAAGYLRVRAGDCRTLARGRAGSAPRRRLAKAHEWIRRRLAMRLGNACGLPTALAIGERGWVGHRTRSRFVHLGISHLLALSGMHLGMLAGVVLLVLRGSGVRGRAALLVVLTVYVGTVGEVVSLYRAYAMAALLVMAVTLERPARLLDVLGAALFLLLLFRPGLAWSLAFQLSFAATLAVVLCVSTIRLPSGTGRLRRFAAASLSTLAVGFSVQVFLLPIQLHYFGAVSVVTPLSTLVFLPFTAALMSTTGVALGLDTIAPGAATVAWAALEVVTAVFELTLALASSWTPAPVRLPVPDLVLYFAGQATWWLGALWRSEHAIGRHMTGIPVRMVLAAALCLVSFFLPGKFFGFL